MNPSTLRQDSYSNSFRTPPASEPYERMFPRPLGRPLGRGRDYQCEVVSAPLPRAATRRVPPPELEEDQPEMPPLPRATTRPVPPPARDETKPETPPLARATTRRVPRPEPEDIKPEIPPQGLLGSLFYWLCGGASARKQLRLVETVPLGEKRFVAIIHAQDASTWWAAVRPVWLFLRVLMSPRCSLSPLLPWQDQFRCQDELSEGHCMGCFTWFALTGARCAGDCTRTPGSSSGSSFNSRH